MRCVRATLVLGLIFTFSAGAAQARHVDANGDGVVRSHKTGATAAVSPRYASIFQSYVDDLETRGAAVRFMGGYRKGSCGSGSQHPCGMALDICQFSRGVVDPRCNLPHRQEMASIAAAHGLFEGGLWCHSDYGHAQIGESARCGDSWPLVARRHHHGRRYAHRHSQRLAGHHHHHLAMR